MTTGREAERAYDPKKLSVEILWGESPDTNDEPILYQFDTQAELRAFCEGIEAGDGWMGYEVVYTDEEYPKEENTDQECCDVCGDNVGEDNLARGKGHIAYCWNCAERVINKGGVLKFDNGLADIDKYERRVRALEAEGMTRSDAQAVADAEQMK